MLGFQNALHASGNRVSCQAVCDYCFLNCLLSNFFHSLLRKKKLLKKKNALCKCIGHCFMRQMLSHEAACVEKGLWAVTLAGRWKTDSLQQLLPFCLQRNSCLSEMQHQSTRCLCLTHLFCISFLFCFFFYHRTAKKA